MKRIQVCVFFIILLARCTVDISPISPLPEEKNPIYLAIGDTWTYSRSFINSGLYDALGLPDTLYGYSHFRVTKDTIIESLLYTIVEGKDYDIAKDTIKVFNKQMQKIEIVMPPEVV
jgi:hypothetical protein